jgi:hypothetical protein
MERLTKILAPLFFALIGTTASAQEEVEMADVMRSNGSIYVVVAIILIVLLGLITYLFLLDRKISRLEKEIKGRS